VQAPTIAVGARPRYPDGMTLPEPQDVPAAPVARPTVRFRWAWWLLAYVSLGTGIVGIFVPGLPTTVFILIAAWAASHGSERLHNRLLQHPQFGPVIRNWQAHGAVSRKGKWMATLTMAVCAGIMLWCVPVAWVKWLSIGCMAAVAVWLWTRPLPPDT
jgi:uncharacterized membrane protein YbaN (DUF454 family)